MDELNDSGEGAPSLHVSDESNQFEADYVEEMSRFDVELDLPVGDPLKLQHAAAAVRQEHRDSSRWKRLECSKVSVFAERDRGTVYVVQVGRSIDFDWTWEGAKAFCPSGLDEPASKAQRLAELSGLYDQDYTEELVWSGEVVEVDETSGCLFIVLDNPEKAPSTGAFLVRPFEFLSVLDAIYNGDEYEVVRERLVDRLTATEGSVHPTVSPVRQAGLPSLHAWWNHAWSILWGPPGTGKTWTTGQQIARVLAAPAAQERILVVSTTNKATDAVALSVGRAATEFCPKELANDTLRRIGQGASLQSFARDDLQGMLAGTESETLAKIDQLAKQLPLFDSWEEKALTRKQIGELRASTSDQSNRLFVDPGKQVVVTTVFKAMSYLRYPLIREMIEEGQAPFTTIFIDEAGLISRAAVAALSLLASRRIVLVGDSKQLAPISRISRVLPTRQQTWLASSGLTHLDRTDQMPAAVHLLSEQRRMHPEVCSVVSKYQYNQVLKTAPDRAAQPSALAPWLADYSRAIWYVLDAEEADLAEIRAERGPGNRSWIRPIAEQLLEKFFQNTQVREAHGLFVTPFKAQAQAASDWFAAWKIKSWEASTVHSQQGSEADIVIFDTVNAGSHIWGIVEWKRLVNVALSRAREAVIVLASASEMEEPYLSPLIGQLKASQLVQEDGSLHWREVLNPLNKHSQPYLATLTTDGSSTSSAFSQCPLVTAEAAADYSRSQSSSYRIGDQMRQREEMKPLLSREQQRISNLALDGKPRLVRGVAGSGKSVVLCNWLAKTALRLGATPDARIWAVYANRSLHKLLCESIEAAWVRLNDGLLLGKSDFPWEQVELFHIKDVLAGLLPLANMSLEPFGFNYDQAAAEFLRRQEAGPLLPRCSALFIDEAQDMGPSTLRLLLSVVEQSDEQDQNSRSAHIFYDNAQNVYDAPTPKWSDFGLDLRGRSTIMRESFRSTRQIMELAINVLERTLGRTGLPDQQELVSLGLLKATSRDGEPWWETLFSQVNGPSPIFHCFRTRKEELDMIAKHLKHLITVDGVLPSSICMLYNGRADDLLKAQLAPELAKWGVELSFQNSRSFSRKSNTLLVTTPHSYKGYESEFVVIPCVDHFVAPEGKLLAQVLYVAMTRARSLLAIYGIQGGSAASQQIIDTLSTCTRLQSKTCSP